MLLGSVMLLAITLAHGVAVPVLVLGGLELLTLSAVSHTALLLHGGGSGFGTASSSLIERVGLSSLTWRGLLLGVFVGASVKLPADLLRSMIERRWPTPDAELLAQAELLRHDTVGQIVALFVAIGLLGPFAEELFYRGVAYRLFERGAGRGAAIWGSSVCFAFAHAGPRDWLPLLGVALFLGSLRARSRGLWAPIAAHVAFNCLALVFVLVGFDVSSQPTSLWWLIGGVGIVAAWWLVRAPLGGSSR
jgi:membrane protease YdiL (CAAX protease family)